MGKGAYQPQYDHTVTITAHQNIADRSGSTNDCIPPPC